MSIRVWLCRVRYPSVTVALFTIHCTRLTSHYIHISPPCSRVRPVSRRVHYEPSIVSVPLRSVSAQACKR